jgi:hypothetical protein
MRYHDCRRRRQEGRYPRAHRPTQAQIEDTRSDYDREKLQERVAKLAGGVVMVPEVPKKQGPAMPGGGGGGMGGMDF